MVRLLLIKKKYTTPHTIFHLPITTMELYLHDIRVEDKNFNNSKIQLFCLEEDGTNVFVEVKGFETYFYVGFDRYIEDATIKALYMAKFKEEPWWKHVSTMTLVKRKRLVGFSDGDLFPYICLTFEGVVPSFVARKALEGLSGKINPYNTEVYDTTRYPGISVYEARSVDPILKFFHSSGLKPSSFFRMENYSMVADKRKKTNCEKEYTVDFKDISPVKTDRKPPPLLICSYDIETSGLSHTEDYIFQVSMVFARMGEIIQQEGHSVDALKDGIVICVGKTESIDGTTIVEVENELELLQRFREEICKRGCNILCGYNTFRFDAVFLYKRAEKYKYNGFKKLSFLKDFECDLEEKTLESSALGKNELKQIIIPGRIEIDLFMVMKRSQKLTSYKLNSVCEKFFGGTKDDITYADILEACTGKDPNKLGIIAKYCYQDSGLVLQLLDKIKEVYDATEMAKLCTVPLTYILGRGQQIKCLSLILNRTHGEYVCNYRAADKVEGEADKEGYKGASVIDAKKGFYEEDPIVTMDFASLYPSIMRLKQLCYTTFVTEEEYLGIEGVKYENHEISDGVNVTFAHRPGQNSILCELEEVLGEERKATKKLMKTEKDPFKYSLLDSKQKAQKVTMNSIYGFTGTVNHGMLPLVEIAAAVTSTGREMIKTTKEYAERVHGCNVVYGDTDSVMVIFPEHKKYTDRKEKMAYCFERGHAVSKEISDLFGHPVLLEFENVYYKYLLVSKKRYAGLSWESVEGPPSMTMKGLVTVRRDNAPFVGKCASKVIDMLMDLDVVDSRSVVKTHIHDTLLSLERSEVPIEELTIRKELKKWEYKNPTPQGTLAKKLLARTKEQRVFREYIRDAYETPGGFNDARLGEIWSKVDELGSILSSIYSLKLDCNAIVNGVKSEIYKKESYKKERSMELYEEISSILQDPSDRVFIGLVSYNIGDYTALEKRYTDFSTYDIVDWDTPSLGDRIPYVITNGTGDISDRAEDPRMVGTGRCKPDTMYYISKQLKNPLVDLLQHVIDSPSDMFTEYERRAVNKRLGRAEITSFFMPASKRTKK